MKSSSASSASSPLLLFSIGADNWTEQCPWRLPISNRTQCQCNGMQFARQIQPIVNMTIRGMIFYQGERVPTRPTANRRLPGR